MKTWLFNVTHWGSSFQQRLTLSDFAFAQLAAHYLMVHVDSRSQYDFLPKTRRIKCTCGSNALHAANGHNSLADNWIVAIVSFANTSMNQ